MRERGAVGGGAPERARELPELIFVADDPALDFLNTVPVINGEAVDLLRTDEDVVRWLRQAGLLAAGAAAKPRAGTLASTARSLREVVRRLVLRRKQGARADTGTFNVFLAEASSYPQLIWGEPGTAPEVVRRSERKTARQLLSPLAEAAANLLAHGDFELVRQCEDGDCVLWFYDRTRSHHRRWCSMATCGNRNKVKAFRRRQQR